jgi:hypothetical protein
MAWTCHFLDVMTYTAAIQITRMEIDQDRTLSQSLRNIACRVHGIPATTTQTGITTARTETG